MARSVARRVLLARRHRGLQASDAFVGSYPKSGNTWLKFMLAELATGDASDFVRTEAVIPMVGQHFTAPALLPTGGRLVKTHERYRGEYKRAVYLVRDVRDVVVSYFYYERWRGTYRGSLERYVDEFVAGRRDGYGPWVNHVRSWLTAAKSSDNIVVVKYEDLRRRPRESLAELSAFVGITVSGGRIREVVEGNTLQAMKAKESRARESGFHVGKGDLGFVRKGSIGGWAAEMDPADVGRVESWAGELLTELGYDSEWATRRNQAAGG